MRLDRGLGHMQARRDLGVRQSACHLCQHLALALGQELQLFGRPGCRLRPPGKFTDQPLGHRRRQQRIARGYHPDGLH
ncbi:MAG TPA: hypothetical protein VND96_11725 [Candidatus Micrarchaeaceae archaeon]|nr:hypothetical protein [Candidatus Micrarchaeaceae archaeon]